MKRDKTITYAIISAIINPPIYQFLLIFLEMTKADIIKNNNKNPLAINKYKSILA